MSLISHVCAKKFHVSVKAGVAGILGATLEIEKRLGWAEQIEGENFKLILLVTFQPTDFGFWEETLTFPFFKNKFYCNYTALKWILYVLLKHHIYLVSPRFSADTSSPTARYRRLYHHDSMRIELLHKCQSTPAVTSPWEKVRNTQNAVLVR